MALCSAAAQEKGKRPLALRRRSYISIAHNIYYIQIKYGKAAAVFNYVLNSVLNPHKTALYIHYINIIQAQTHWLHTWKKIKQKPAAKKFKSTHMHISGI